VCGGWGLDQNLRKQSCEQTPYASLKALLGKPIDKTMVNEKTVQCKENNFKTLGIGGIGIEACIALGLFLMMLVRCS